jgi:hypothetical protein
MLLLTLLAALITAIHAAGSCRCTALNATCWNAVPWQALNSSVYGRLAVSADPLYPCRLDPASQACGAALNSTDDEFFLTGQPNGFLHTGRCRGFSVLVQSSNTPTPSPQNIHPHQANSASGI